jgi:hypothetical protein
MCVAPTYHALLSHDAESRRGDGDGDARGDGGLKGGQAHRFSLGLPKLGFYHRKDVSGNAGAAFHDMLYDRALLSDESSRVCYVGRPCHAVDRPSPLVAFCLARFGTDAIVL